MDPAAHWDAVYDESGDDDVSWTQREPAMSLRMLERAGVDRGARVVDIGCGARGLVNVLATRGWRHVSGLDLSAAALRRARDALGPRAEDVTWVQEDVLSFAPERPFDVWHDRAVFHFLTREEEHDAYRAALHRSLRRGGHAIIGTFALDGPERCSGLPVARYDADGIARALGDAFELVEGARETHATPWGAQQPFAWALLKRA